MAHLTPSRFFRDIRRERPARRFYTLVASAIIHHAAPADVDPEDRPTAGFVCGACGHARALCTCIAERKAS